MSVWVIQVVKIVFARDNDVKITSRSVDLIKEFAGDVEEKQTFGDEVYSFHRHAQRTW